MLHLHASLEGAKYDGPADPSSRFSARMDISPLRQKAEIVSHTNTDQFARSSPRYQIDPTDLWEESKTSTSPTTLLPEWMKRYFRFHKEARAQWTQTRISNKNHTQTPRILLLECHETSTHCGGTADRLSAMPVLLRWAAQSHRLLLIYWGRPAPLERFLLPPVGGLDWRVPLSHQARLLNPRMGKFASTQDDILRLVDSPTISVVHCRFQAHDHGADYFNSQKDASEHSFEVVSRDVWRILFTPSLPLQNRIVQVMNDMGLAPNQYVSTHLRALYAVSTREPDVVNYWTRNAINCSSHYAIDASTSHEQQPIYFTADNRAATLLAYLYGSQMGVNVVKRSSTAEPLHLDKATNWETRDPSEFYDSFVDLYLLSMSRCVAFGMGGYGKFASWLSYNASCSMQHHAAVGITACELAENPSKRTRKVNAVPVNRTIFHPPMPIRTDLNTKIQDHDGMLPEKVFPDLQKAYSSDLWIESSRLPDWMKEYFSWHKQQRALLNESNWSDFRFLVMECVKDAAHCGGTADRLRPVPFVVRLAAENKRILLIHWEKPKSLESFLLPPVHGVDWRTPSYIAQRLHSRGAYGAVNKILPAVKDKERIIVQSRLQVHDHGSSYYDSQAAQFDEPHLTFRDVYHDCWYSLFTPVEQISSLIAATLEKLMLPKGRYAFDHLRANYGIEKKGRDPALIKNWTINSLNCISNIQPGGPIFFSSDSAYAKKVAVEYGVLRSTPVVARLDASDPVHLDLV